MNDIMLCVNQGLDEQQAADVRALRLQHASLFQTTDVPVFRNEYMEIMHTGSQKGQILSLEGDPVADVEHYFWLDKKLTTVNSWSPSATAVRHALQVRRILPLSWLSS